MKTRKAFRKNNIPNYKVKEPFIVIIEKTNLDLARSLHSSDCLGFSASGARSVFKTVKIRDEASPSQDLKAIFMDGELPLESVIK
jgi:hypothetical protein